VIIAGDGARGAAAALTALAERLGAPVVTTFRAKGLVSDDHPLGAGVLGRSGTPVASWLMNEADLLLVVGASSSNHTGIAAYKPLIFVDDDPAAIGRFHPVQVGLLGDAAVTTRALLEGLGTTLAAEDQRGDVAGRWAIWRAEKERRAGDDRGRGLSAAAVFDALSRHAPAEAVFTVDVGNHAYSFGRYLESRGQHVLMSGYLGSIGFGYPAAFGAWAADPTSTVIAVTGDGGFGQYLAELTTAVKYRIGIKHLLLDNGALGKIAKEQVAADYPTWHTSLVNPDFAEFARLCGATGFSARTRAELEQAMPRWLTTDGPTLLHVHQDIDLV
jgi:thiamine pyrophosphate-dependent acetolactate synthase large subunit-like protein